MTTSDQDFSLAAILNLAYLTGRERHAPAELVHPAFNLDRVTHTSATHVADVNVGRHSRLLAAALCDDGHAGGEVDNGRAGGAVDTTQRVDMFVFKDHLAGDTPFGGGRDDGHAGDEKVVRLRGGDLVRPDSRNVIEHRDGGVSC